MLDILMKCDLLKPFDERVTKNITAAAIITRPAKSNGLWCCVLLPTILFLYKTLYHVSDIYSFTTYVAIGLLLNSLLFVMFASITYSVLTESVYGGSLACSFVSTILVCVLMKQDVSTALMITAPPILCLYPMLRSLLVNYSNTFTLGEAIIVVQSLLLIWSISMGKLFLEHTGTKADINNTVVFVFWIALSSIAGIMYILPNEERTIMMMSVIFSIVGGISVLVLHILLGFSFLIDFVYYIVLNKKRVKLVMFWLFLILTSIVALVTTVKKGVKADTVKRKSFHLLASLVFASGILIDLEFMKLAAGLAFGLVMFMEAMRKLQIENLSPALQSGFDAYCDEKDTGFFAVTPIYLFSGLACPLLLVPEHLGCMLELLSGVLSIGVGDTAASWFGSRFGVRKWPDNLKVGGLRNDAESSLMNQELRVYSPTISSERTQEGTIANMISQVVLVYILKITDLLDTNLAMIRVVVAATASSLVEATTDQIDNLILPLVTLLVFQIISCVF